MNRIFRKTLAGAMTLVMIVALLLPTMIVNAAATVKIACVGDSITAGSQASSSAFHYPTQLQALLGSGYDVRNFGTSGRTMLSKGDNPYVNDGNYTRSKEFAPDYVTIMLGTNDSKPQNWSHKADFEGDMKAMITAYRNLSSHPVVIVCTSPTVGTTNIGISEAVVTGEIVPLEKKVAAEMGCPVIDINALTKNAPQNYADGIHPNDAGYTAMAKMFYDGLQDIFTAEIKGFAIGGVPATIDNDAATISLILPFGTSVTSLTPDITLADGAKVDKSGAQNFTNPVRYTVTSPDGKTTKTYTVTVKAQAKIKVACVGDSITAGAGGSNGINYPQQLGLNLGSGYDVRNFGNSGKTLLKDGIDGTNVVSGYVTTDTYRNSINFNPDVVIFMLGTNDSKPQNWVPLGDKFEDEYRELLQVYLDLPSHPTVYVATSPTAHNAGGYGISPGVIHEEIVPIEKKVAAEMGLKVIDMHALTADNGSEFPDNIHPNNDGYVRMGRDFADFIQHDVTTMEAFTLANGANRIDTVGVIDDAANTVSLTVPASTDVTALEPKLTLPAGATYSPVGAQDFTSPVTYTVTAADGSTKREYVVTVTKQKKFKVACVGDSMTFAEQYPNALTEFLGGDFEIGRFGQNSTTAQKTGLKENGQNPNSGAYTDQGIYQQSLNFKPDFVLLMLGANDSKQGVGEQGGHKLVVNWTENSPAQFEQDLKDLVTSYQALGAKVVLGTSPSGFETSGNWGAKPQIVTAQIAPIQRKVAAEMGCWLADFNAHTQGRENELIGGDGLHPNFNGYYQLAGLYYVGLQDAMASIDSFAVGSDIGTLDQIDKNVFVSVPDGTDLTALDPDVALANGAVSDKTGAQNFGQAVTYTVTSAGGWAVPYTVSVTSPSGVQVSKIEILTLPDKTEYQLGEDLDLTGATATVIYTDGSREVIDVTADMVSGYDWLTLGKQALTVTYEGKTAPLTVAVKPYGILGSFSTREGKARVLRNGENLLYADWRWIDQADHKLDLSGYDLSRVTLEMDITFGSDQENVNFQNFWHTLVIKLRSTDKTGVAGDPEMNSGNAEHNYGWNLTPNSFADPSSIHVSIPLNTAAGNHKGVMDWSEVGRIIIQCWFQDQYKNNSIDHYMDIQNIYILDQTRQPAAPDTAALQAAVDAVADVDTDAYTDETAAAFTKALEKANAYLVNPYAAQESVDAAAQALTEAREALEEKPAVALGDVDNDGDVTAADALLALQAATDKVELSETQQPAADVDGKDGVTAADALLILQFATAKIDAFPVSVS